MTPVVTEVPVGRRVARSEVPMWWMAMGLANAGELWLHVEDTDEDGDRITLVLPASTLRDPGSQATLTTTTGPVDLATQAKALREGERRTFATDDGTVVLEHAAASSGASTTLALRLGTAEGFGFTFDLPLDPASVDTVQDRGGVDLDVNGLDLKLDDVGCAQLRRSAPRELLRVVGPAGHGLVVTTR